MGKTLNPRPFPTEPHFLLETELRNPETNCTVHKLVYLSLGSNLGDRSGNLQEAITRLTSLGEVLEVSSFYETEPVELLAQPWFLNCAVKLNTEKMPRQLLRGVLEIEKKMGRRRGQKKGPRNIDIDILLFGNSTVETHGLTIPHPTMHERRFVLEPLTEIAPEARHPGLKRTVRELLDALPAGQAVRKASLQSSVFSRQQSRTNSP
jgi:2-amino-4-hydroxy-6-hydroxymethyldihydropteridine diphosphokinase